MKDFIDLDEITRGIDDPMVKDYENKIREIMRSRVRAGAFEKNCELVIIQTPFGETMMLVPLVPEVPMPYDVPASIQHAIDKYSPQDLMLTPEIMNHAAQIGIEKTWQ